jgi:hypothetical protein
MDKITSGSIEMTWDPESRLAFISFQSETRATGKDALVLVDALRRWIGTDYKPFGLMGDGGKLGHVDADYRSVWRKFFLEHRENVHIAFFNLSPIIRIAAEMFGVGTRLRLKTFDDEDKARAWMREVGIA